VSAKTIDSYHIRVYMNARRLGITQADAAEIAEISSRSGQRIESGTLHPQRGRSKPQRTVPDPLAEVWDKELEPMLVREPKLKAMTLFEYLQEMYPGQYPQVLRTLQRRVQTWKVLHGKPPEVMFELRHEPGMMGLSDFTHLKNVQVTIQGHPYDHLLYHYRLAYSGWQYALVIEGGESFVALCEGLQNALFLSGGAPQQHRTDSLSAAYRNLGGKHPKPLTRLYDDLCAHYRVQPTRNNLRKANENGSIESPHGHLKNRIEQAIYLRGSADFASVAEYQALIDDVTAKLNRPCQAKFEQEQSCLQPLPKYRLPDYEVLSVRVSRRSTMSVRRILYTVPSRLIGRRLEVHLYHNRMVGYFGRQPVVALPRMRVSETENRRGRCIDYRHVIEGLRRKPRAFLYCTWQHDLLPNEDYKALWSQLKTQFPLDEAARLIVEALYIAATQNQEHAVAEYLQRELAAGTLTRTRLTEHFTFKPPANLLPLTVTQPDLSKLLSI
jgi:DNA-binding XRE family transcriptional regulator